MFKGLWALRGRRAGQDPLGATLGRLERECMDVLWAGGDFTVRDVQGRIDRPVAYTTVMTTLDRLYKKGFVARVRARAGRAFIYTAAQSREQVEAAAAAGVLSGLLSTGSTAAMPILSNLVEAVGEEDGGLALLDTLEQLVREKRRHIGGRDE